MYSNREVLKAEQVQAIALMLEEMTSTKIAETLEETLEVRRATVSN